MKKNEKIKICLAIDLSNDKRELIEEGLKKIDFIIDRYKQRKIIVIATNTLSHEEYKVTNILKDIKLNQIGMGENNIKSALERSIELESDLTFVITNGNKIDGITKYNTPRLLIWVVPDNTPIENFNKLGYICT